MSYLARPNVAPFDAIRREDASGEYWISRDLMPVMAYPTWQHFRPVIERAMHAAKNTGVDVTGNFTVIREVSGQRGPDREDYRLTRYAAYLVAMNGDPRKPEVAAAQTYFAVKTREAETATSVVRMPSARELAQLVIQEADRADAAEAKVAELEPAAEAWQTLATASGDYSVADAAKILSRDPLIRVGRDRLFTILRELRWVYRQELDGRHRAYQAAIELGRLMELPSSHYHPRTGELVLDPPQVRVTVKGLEFLHRHLGGSAPTGIAS